MTGQHDQILDALKKLAERVESLEKTIHDLHTCLVPPPPVYHWDDSGCYRNGYMVYQSDIGVGDKPGG